MFLNTASNQKMDGGYIWKQVVKLKLDDKNGAPSGQCHKIKYS